MMPKGMTVAVQDLCTYFFAAGTPADYLASSAHCNCQGAMQDRTQSRLGLVPMGFLLLAVLNHGQHGMLPCSQTCSAECQLLPATCMMRSNHDVACLLLKVKGAFTRLGAESGHPCPPVSAYSPTSEHHGRAFS